jgi:cell division transport system permease protein
VRLRAIVSEAVRSLGATMSTTVAATLTVLIGMFVLGVSIALGTWVLSWSDHVKNQLEVKLYFTMDATGRQMNAVRARLIKEENAGRVRTFQFISKQEAYTIMKKQQPDLVNQLPFNPFPASYKIVPVRAEYNAGIRTDLLQMGPAGAKPSYVDKVDDGGATSRRILRVGSIVEVVFLVGLIVLLVASTLLIANTIRLSIFARRREIEVMKLVGATNWFVRGPFMVEGLLCGVVGAFMAVILLLIGKLVVLPAILGHIKDSKDVHAMGFELIALLMIAAGLMLGAAGSGLTVRRFLRV